MNARLWQCSSEDAATEWPILMSPDKRDQRGIRRSGNRRRERRREGQRQSEWRGMREDEGGETRERKQTATVVEKGQGAGAREKIKNGGEGVKTKLCSFMRAPWSWCFRFDTDDQKMEISAATSRMIYLLLISCPVKLLLLDSFDNSKRCFLQTLDLTTQHQHQVFISFET